MTSDATSQGAAKHPAAGVRAYTLGILFVVYVVNFVDRQILSILMEPIREDLNLNDTQLGLLSGLAFALFYATMGLPIAWLADRFSRRNIIAVCLALWSAFTALCGLSQTFVQLLLARMGVAVGEAGGSPPAHSMIADLYPHGQRSTALAIYACGVPVGTLIGLAGGGWISTVFDWRVAFLVVGAPGVLLALVFFLTVREPAREKRPQVSAEQPAKGMLSGVAELWKIRSYRHLCIATTIHVFSAYGILQWNPAFFIRIHGLTPAEVGLTLGLIIGIASGLGTFAGGYVADVLGRRDPRWYCRIPALEIGITIPFYIGAFLADDVRLAFALLIAPTFLSNAFMGPVFGAAQSLAAPHLRATASAFLLFILALVGQGLGPQVVGVISDLLKPSAGADSLRYALVLLVLTKVFASWRFMVAGGYLREDLAPKTNPKSA
jgi:predicted MFS family arabinose efflux permease